MAKSTDVRVFVVDHKPYLLRAIVAMLHDAQGVQVVGAVFLSTAAVELAESIDCDVVLYGFNVLDSYALDGLRVLRAKLPDAYIIASSVGQMDDRSAEALEAGADEYLEVDRLAGELVPRVLAHKRRQA